MEEGWARLPAHMHPPTICKSEGNQSHSRLLEQTEVGNRIPERTREEHEEGRDAAWGWVEEAWEEPLGFARA